TTDTARGEKRLPSEQNQAILKSSGRPLGECRLKTIVEPTFLEFQQNPTSLRHAYLACAATFHAVDRAAYPRRTAGLREKWSKESPDFFLVDLVAHDFKHIKSDLHGRRHNLPRHGIPISFAVYGKSGFNTHLLNDSGEIAALRNLVFVVRDAIKFLYAQTR
ncbi:MAG: hypothetical protein V4514_21355, partial [Pseudomonadota bacterium]|uniref:hypothetical protein n=1 Tax=Phenylobacterium sp. TaxID=1871053 RepID=UPI0025F5EE4C